MKVKHLALFTVACNVVQFYFPFLHSSLILNLCQFCWCINTHSEKEIEVLKKSIFKLILNTFVKIRYQCFNVRDSYSMWTQGHPHLAHLPLFIVLYTVETKARKNLENYKLNFSSHHRVPGCNHWLPLIWSSFFRE